MKYTKKLKIGLLNIGLMLITVNVLAQTQQSEKRKQKRPTIAELIKKLDSNEDGKLSKSEVKRPLEKDFAKIDTNEDGYLSKEELENAPKPKRGKRGRRK